jgi:uncharacterized protein YqgC (DUF456 family)
MAVALLGVALVCALLIIPLGLPGTWLMVGVAIVYRLAEPASGIGAVTIGGVAALALVAEVAEFALAARFTKRFGGSRRAGWGAVIGGFAGVVVGVPLPVVGSVVGGLVGSFVGAMIGELETGSHHHVAVRAATGAMLGRAAAAAMKVAIGVVMAVWVVVAASS